MNKFQFMGRLTKDVELKTTSNAEIVKFSIAVNRKYTDSNGERQTDFFNLTAFGKTAEFINKYFKKGQQILVEGRIQNRTWEDENGQKRYATDFIVEQCYFVGIRKNNENGMINGEEDDFITIDDTEELPF